MRRPLRARRSAASGGAARPFAAAWLCTALAANAQGLPAPTAQPAAARPSAAVADPPAATAPAAPSAAALPEAHPFRSSSTPSGAGEYTLGEPFTLEIAVDHPAEDTYSFPDKAQLPGFTLRGEVTTTRLANAQGAETRFVLPLVIVGTLTPEIPPLTLLVHGPQGARSFAVPAKKLKLRSLVAAEGEASMEHAHHGPKPPVPVLVRSFLWAWVLLGVALAGLAFFLWRRRQARLRAAAALVPAVVISPDEEAIGRLAALSRRAPWKQGLGRATIFEVSEIVRGYLGRRLSFDALDLTTDELIGQLRERALPGLELPAFIEASRWDDLVKFAKLEPTDLECADAIERGLTLVTRTRRPAEPASTGSAQAPQPQRGAA